MRGLFVTLEGPDGSGKTTLSRGLEEKLREGDLPYILTREPGGTDISEKIRGIILDTENEGMDACCEALLYAAARAQHTREKILPSLEEGRLVISDRYVLSSLAYQGCGREVGIQEVAEINNFATGGLKPDLVLFLDVDPITVLERKALSTAQDRLEKESENFHLRVYEGYQQALQYADKVKVIDARQSPSQVIEEAWYTIKKAWEERR